MPGGTPSRSNLTYWHNGTIPWVRSEVCKEGYVEKSQEMITEAGLKNSNAKIFPANTTLLALVGATKGKTAFKAVTENITAFFNCRIPNK